MTDLTRRYHAFMAQPVIRDFQARGGRVFIACENRPASTIATLIAAGHRHFAEKFVQETAAKWPALRQLAPDITLHDFGRLQGNKALAATRLFDAIESIDRDSLLPILARARPLPLYIQVNTGREAQKGGVAPDQAEALLAACHARLGRAAAGVMAIPPRDADPRPHFRWLRRFMEQQKLAECMMGMSNDYAIAIAEGATMIRVARAVFGE